MKFRLLAVPALALSMALGAMSQTEVVPEFEAASIKAAPPSPGNFIRVMMRGGPGSDDPGRVDWNNVSIKQMITAAFNVKDYQVQGPDWLNSERFDVAAKVPSGTTREQFRLMIQKFLADRFKMTFHHENKEHAAYALTVAKGGPKLKESDPNDTSGFAPMPVRGGDGVTRQVAPPPPPPPPGGRGTGPGGGGRGMMMSMPGHFQAKAMQIGGLANMLSNLTGKPVIDETNLKGNYDFTLDYAPDSIAAGPMGALPPPVPGGPEMPVAPDMSGLPITAAVEKELGLKLEPKKLPLDNIVIDRIEKIPTEN